MGLHDSFTIVESHTSKVEEIIHAIQNVPSPSPFIVLEALPMDLLQSLLGRLAHRKESHLIHLVFFVRDVASLLNCQTAIAACAHVYGT